MSDKPDYGLQFAHFRAKALGPRVAEVPWADLPPGIIHTLRVLLDPESFPTGHREWVQKGARAILNNWERTEDLEQLKRDLGLTASKKRRKALTMKAETAIVAAMVDAALAGKTDPKKAGAEKLRADERKAQRAWKAWGAFYLERLRMQEPYVSPEDQTRIRTAIKLLSDTKS